jgi:DNA segregation ATPase FtsK/SpoIIIE-like protein
MDALVQFAQQVLQQRTQLENQLLQLQGNTTELRRRERDALHESNRAIYDQIKALEDTEKIRSAWKSIGDGLMNEVNRIRGMVAIESGYSLAYLQSEFAILTAATRAGDQVAGGKLSGVASAISEAAAMEARSALELAVMRSNVANSLERTNQIVTGAPVSVNTPILTSNAAEDTKAMRSQIEALNARINELTTNSKAENQAQFNALNRLVSIMDNATQGGSMAVRTINGETVKTS